jgi:hypothetical protein
MVRGHHGKRHAAGGRREDVPMVRGSTSVRRNPMKHPPSDKIDAGYIAMPSAS